LKLDFERFGVLCRRSIALSLGVLRRLDGDTRHPLFLYFVGTQFVSTDESARYDSQAALKIGDAMARRGFVSLSVEYDNQLAAILNKLNKASGMSASDCPDDGRDHCLRPDGSGWVVVRKSACVSSSADHCWFDRRSCIDSAITLEPNWIDPHSASLFALEANADWVAATVARP
jgi:hypothetical protein